MTATQPEGGLGERVASIELAGRIFSVHRASPMPGKIEVSLAEEDYVIAQAVARELTYAGAERAYLITLELPTSHSEVYSILVQRATEEVHLRRATAVISLEHNRMAAELARLGFKFDSREMLFANPPGSE